MFGCWRQPSSRRSIRVVVLFVGQCVGRGEPPGSTVQPQRSCPKLNEYGTLRTVGTSLPVSSRPSLDQSLASGKRSHSPVEIYRRGCARMIELETYRVERAGRGPVLVSPPVIERGCSWLVSANIKQIFAVTGGLPRGGRFRCCRTGEGTTSAQVAGVVRFLLVVC